MIRSSGFSRQIEIKVLYGALAVTQLLSALSLQAQPRLARPVTNIPSSTPNRSNGQAVYTTRVCAIAIDVRWSLASLYNVWEKFADEREQLNTPKRSTDVESLTKTHDKTKTQLLVALNNIETNSVRLRSISPVPLNWKKWDNKLIAAAWDFARGKEQIETWLLQPSGEIKNMASKHLRRAQSTLDGVLQEIQKRTEPAIRGKKYGP